MKNPKPLSATTRVDPATGDWCPASFTDFLSELERLTSRGLQTDSLILYRGHKRREWLLDSTFARSCKSVIFGVPIEQRLSALHVESSEYHHALAALYLLKFGEVVVPSAELVVRSINQVTK